MTPYEKQGFDQAVAKEFEQAKRKASKGSLPLASDAEMAARADALAMNGEVKRNPPIELLPYEMLCEIYARNKDELAGNARAMFYLLRGALAASAVRDGYDIVELLDLFTDDIRFMAGQVELPPFTSISLAPKKRGKK